MGLGVVMLTGDHQRTAIAIAAQAGIDRVLAEVLPEAKARQIDALREAGSAWWRWWRRHQRRAGPGAGRCGHRDGSGTGRGHRGRRRHADARRPARRVRPRWRLSRRTIRIVKENLAWAFGYNVVLIPVAAGLLYPVIGVLLSPILAGAAMAFSSVSVVTNSLRLKRWRPSDGR
jgi:Cu+-exporting ATPase